jgi:hypothetical protein
MALCCIVATIQHNFIYNISVMRISPIQVRAVVEMIHPSLSHLSIFLFSGTCRGTTTEKTQESRLWTRTFTLCPFLLACGPVRSHVALSYSSVDPYVHTLPYAARLLTRISFISREWFSRVKSLHCQLPFLGL